MKLSLAVAGAILLSAVSPAFAHRVDEYLQATMLSVGTDFVRGEIRLVPGVAVFPVVFASIDTDANGVLSEGERSDYAARVLRDLSLTIDGASVRLSLMSARFADAAELKEGLGEIRFEFRADLPRGGPNRKLVFQNHHQSRIAAYLVNSLVASDPDIRITAQNRNEDQSVYQLDYAQAGVRASPLSPGWWSTERLWAGAAALLLLVRFVSAWHSRSAASSRHRLVAR
jgi:hypothetical protein